MELAQQWLDAQKATPSFVAGYAPQGNVSAVNAAPTFSSILDAPLPAGLMSSTPTRTVRSQHSARTPQPSSIRLAHTPGRAIHDELIAKGKLYQQRKEALQERALKEQVQQLRAPKISAEARNMPQREPFHTRFLKNHQKREEEKEMHLKLLEKDDEEELRKLHSFKPKISARGRRATGKVNMMIADQHDQWQARREEHLEAERAKRIVEELQEVRDGPDINPRSQRLAAKRMEKEGLSGMGHAEAMLERDRLAKLALWERQQKTAIEGFNPNPKITMYAAALPRSDTDVGDRLYQAAFEAAERKAELARQAIEAQHHSPRISKVALQSRSRSQRIEDDLMERHLQALADRERAVLEDQRRNKHQHTPAINPVSDAIAAQLPVSSRERLTQPSYRSVSSHADPNAESESESRIRLTAPSARSTSQLGPEQRAEIFARQEERRLRRAEELRQEAERRELAECTFKPYTSPGPTRRGGGGNTPTGGSLPDRSLQWAKKREQWRQEQLRAREEDETAGCTFAPVTHDPRDVQRALTPHRTIYGGEGRAWGTEEFLQRQRLARERQEMELRKQTETGSKWRNRTTVPEEPKLGRTERSGSHIKALARPMDAPRYYTEMGDDADASVADQRGMMDDYLSAPRREGSAVSAFSGVPAQSHFSTLHRADLHRPIVPFAVHEHRAAFGY